MDKIPLAKRIKDALLKRHNQPRVCSHEVDPERLAAERKQDELANRIQQLECQINGSEGIQARTAALWEEKRKRDDPNYTGVERREARHATNH